MPDWNKIEEEYKTTELSMKALAEKHGVKASTLRSRKNREGWTKENETSQRNKTKNNTTQRKSVATQKAIEQLEQNDQLTDKQKQFCLLYLKYFNATKAYQEAYGVDYKTADAIAYRLLGNDGIKKELERLKKIQRSELYIDSLDIKKEWLKQAFVDPTDYVEFGTREEQVMGMFGPLEDDEGNPITETKNYVMFKNSEQVDGTLIKEVRMGKDGPVIQFHDKQKAMDRLMEFLVDAEESSADSKIVIVDNSNDERMKKWVEDNGGL